MMRTLIWITRFFVRRLIGMTIGAVIFLIFGRSRTGRNVRLSLNLFRRFTRF